MHFQVSFWSLDPFQGFRQLLLDTVHIQDCLTIIIKGSFNRVNTRKCFLRTTSSDSSLSFESACGFFLLAFSTTGGAPIVKIRAKKQSRPIVISMINLNYEIFIWTIGKLRSNSIDKWRGYASVNKSYFSLILTDRYTYAKFLLVIYLLSHSLLVKICWTCSNGPINNGTIRGRSLFWSSWKKKE